MHDVTDVDRRAAEELRALLADVSGFWHVPGDDGPLCVAMARHREMCELRLLQSMSSGILTATARRSRAGINATRVRREEPQARVLYAGEGSAEPCAISGEPHGDPVTYYNQKERSESQRVSHTFSQA